MKGFENKPDLTQTLPLITKETPSPTLISKKRRPEKRVHSSKEPILCRGIDCKKEFLPIRKDQVFCSLDCKSKYFAIARKLGTILLENHAVEFNPIEDDSEAYKVKFNGQVFRLKTKLKGKGEDEDD